MVRARYQGALWFRMLSAAVSLVFLLAFTGVGYAVGSGTESTSTAGAPQSPEAPAAEEAPAQDPAPAANETPPENQAPPDGELVPASDAPATDAASATTDVTTTGNGNGGGKKSAPLLAGAAPLVTTVTYSAPSRDWSQLATIDSDNY